MADPDDLLRAARRILGGAERDLERGLHLSACVSAHRAAVLATQAWLEDRGQVHVTTSVGENVGLAPTAEEEVREAALLLDRHGIEEGSPAATPAPDRSAEAADVIEAGRRVLAFVDGRMEEDRTR